MKNTVLPVIPGNEPVIDEVPCEVTTVDYCGDFIYVNGVLKRMLFPGGYVTFRNDSIECPEYHFYLTDHQGNVRIVANQDGTIEQINHYYPYGGLMGESTNSDHQPYKYNGKELDRHHGLDWYDYGARWYNGYSWTTPDPLAEKYYDTSPYVYCADNPIKYIDPDGKEKKEYLNYNDLQKSDYSLYPENTPGVLNIWAHGLYSKQYDEYAFSIDLGNKGLVKNSQDFREKILKTSNEWQKSGGENITIVLHACGTSEFAKALSNDKMFKGKNITFIAPNAMLKTTTYRSGKKETRVKDKVYYNIKKGWEKVKTVKGKWMAYKDGKLVTIYPSNAQPGIDTMQDDDRINKKKKKK